MENKTQIGSPIKKTFSEFKLGTPKHKDNSFSFSSSN